MNARLFRFTPHGGKPNHYTDSFRSATGGQPARIDALNRLAVGDMATFVDGSWERIA